MIRIGLTLERNLRQSWDEAGGPGTAQSGRLLRGSAIRSARGDAAHQLARPLSQGRRGVRVCPRGARPVAALIRNVYLGIALNNYLILTAAAAQGAQTLAFGSRYIDSLPNGHDRYQ